MMGQGETLQKSVAVTYDAADYRALYRHCKPCRNVRALLALLILCVPIVLPSMFGDRGWSDIVAGLNWADWLPYLLIAALVWAVLPRAQAAARQRSGISAPIEFTFGKDGVGAILPNQETLYRWKGFNDVQATPERLFLYTTRSCALILPRRCFNDEASYKDWTDRALRFWNLAKSVTVE